MGMPQNGWFITETPAKMDENWGHPHLWNPHTMENQKKTHGFDASFAFWLLCSPAESLRDLLRAVQSSQIASATPLETQQAMRALNR